MLNIVDQLRKYGLESMLSLPQLVVCGDQSAGKSSVLEALTEIPFPRNDNLCTRFATEIILRRATSDAITIKVIPDSDRPTEERTRIEAFRESITSFDELPALMDKATTLMGINSGQASNSKAFFKDVLSIEIEGHSRPQLTLVDLPGLIQTQTKGVTGDEVQLVTEITDQYISQHRTICLAVVSATNDYANQGILKKVREVDPKGERTPGLVTKPDRLSSGSGSETSFIGLARNEDIFFKLGWHVLKNRSFEQTSSSFDERNASEVKYFRKSNFSTLPKDCVGITSLRNRLSQLLFNHVKQELPKLREDLDEELTESRSQLEAMGKPRATREECKAFLMQLSLNFFQLGKAAVNGHYEGDYFTCDTDTTFSLQSPTTICRLRAVVQYLNTQFSQLLRTRGYKFHIDKSEPLEVFSSEKPREALTALEDLIPGMKSLPAVPGREVELPYKLSKSEALDWVRRALIRTRGKELPGAFNPLLIGELFWEQSEKWRKMAEDHVEDVADICRHFAKGLLSSQCPKDVYTRIWSTKIEDTLKIRSEKTLQELERILQDLKSFPSTYNHYYTDTIKKRRNKTIQKTIVGCMEDATEHLANDHSDDTSLKTALAKGARAYSEAIDPDMEKYSCEEALDSLHSIYKVSTSFQKTLP